MFKYLLMLGITVFFRSIVELKWTNFSYPIKNKLHYMKKIGLKIFKLNGQKHLKFQKMKVSNSISIILR